MITVDDQWAKNLLGFSIEDELCKQTPLLLLAVVIEHQ